MNLRFKLWAIVIITIGLILFAYLVLGVSPPQASNRLIVRKGDSNWSLSNEKRIYGKTIWSQFADYPEETIKLYYCRYWGGVLVDKIVISWEDETGSFSSRSLSLNDLVKRQQNSRSIFKFGFENEYYKVSFNIPKVENGNYKYSDLSEAWDIGELYQIIEEW